MLVAHLSFSRHGDEPEGAAGRGWLKIVSIQFQIVTPLFDRTVEKAGPRIFNFISSY